MRNRIIAGIIIVLMLLGAVCAAEEKTELAPYSLKNISDIQEELDLFLADEDISIGGDDMRGQLYRSWSPGITIQCTNAGNIVNLTVNAGGGRFTLFGIALGMRGDEAKSALHDYCTQNAIPIGYEEWYDTSLYLEFDYDENQPELDYGFLGLILDNGVVTEISQYYL